MPNKKTPKIIAVLFISLFAGLFASQTLAAVGFQVGTSTLNLGSGENLMYGLISSGSNAASSLLRLDGGVGSTVLRVDRDGKMGLGVSAPGYALDANTVGTDSYFRFQAPSSTQNVGVTLGRNGVNQWYMYSPANTTDFRISGLAVTDPFTIKDTTGYVGIGTTNPSGRFEVSGGATQTGGDLIVDTTGVGTVTIGRLDSTSGNNTSFIFRDRLGSVKSRWDNAGSGSIGFGNFTDGYGIKIQTGAVSSSVGNIGALFKVDSTGFTNPTAIFMGGNVGIGTTTPNTKLQISNSGLGYLDPAISIGGGSGAVPAIISLSRTAMGRVSGIYYQTNSVNDWFSGTYYNGGSGQSSFGIGTGVDISNQKLILNSTGNVGIGTTTPTTATLVIGTSTSNYSIDAGNYRVGNVATPISNLDAANKSYVDSVSNPVGASTSTAGYWTGNGANGIYNNNSGNVGIGTTNPDNGKLTILKNSTYSTENTSAISIQSNATNAFTELLLGSDDNLNIGYIQTAGKNTSWTSKALALQPNGGNVGIGTTNPSSPLEIKNNATSGYVDTLKLNASGAISGHDISMTNSYGRNLRIRQYNSNGTGPLSGSAFFQENGGSLLFVTNTANPIFFATNNRWATADMVINANGNVGIGYTSPGYILDTNTATGDAYNRFMSTDATQNVGVILGRNGLNQWYMYSPANTTDFRISGLAVTDPFTIKDTTGYVGVGTTNPGTNLDIRGTNKLIGVDVNQRGNLFIATTDEPNINVGGSIVLGGRYLTGQPNLIPFATIHGKKETAASGNNGGFLAFETANNSVSPYTFERMRITSAGNVGIGTTSPQTNLHVYGSARIGKGVDAQSKTLDIGGNFSFDTVANTTNAQVQGMSLANGGSGSIPAGTYYYAVVFSTAEGDTGVVGLTYSGFPSITLGGSSRVNISNVPISADPRVTSRKIYRSQAGTVGDYYYLYYIGTIADNTTTTFADNTSISTSGTDWMYNKNNTTAGIFYRDGSVAGRIGDYVTAFGNSALGSLTKGSTNAAFGSYTLSSLTLGDSNSALGHSAGSSVTTGANNNYFGYSAGQNNSTGSSNNGFGYGALRNETADSTTGNNGFGMFAGGGTVAGNNYNNSIGYYAGYGARSTAGVYIGYQSGRQTTPGTVGNYNIVLGSDSGKVLGAGAYNVLIGTSVELAAPASSNQLNIGNVLYATGLGAGSVPSASGKMGIGTTSPTTATLVISTSTTNYSFDAGNYRIGGIGAPVLNSDAATKSYVDSAAGSGGQWALSGSNLYVASTSLNVGIGTTNPGQQLEITKNFKLPATTGATPYGIIYKGATPFLHNFNYGNNGTVTTMGSNLFLGLNAGNFSMGSTATNMMEGSWNVGFGDYTLNEVTKGYGNTALGYNALSYITTGNSNVAVGTAAGQSYQPSNNNNLSENSVFLGAYTKSYGYDQTNEIVIGALAIGNGSNSVTLGDDNITKTILKGKVGLGTTNPTTATLVIATSTTNYSFDAGNYRIGGVGAPVLNSDAATKSYVDSVMASSSGSGVFTSNINLSGNNILNVNKLTVNTIDPLYNIRGVNYSSFAASIVGGVKEEYAGRTKVAKKVKTASGIWEYEKVFDFDQVEPGSDLWVWRQTVDFSSDKVEVIATPYGARADIYYFINDNQLVFRSDRIADISFRLTGRRFDWREWPTRAIDQKEKAGFIIK